MPSNLSSTPSPTANGLPPAHDDMGGVRQTYSWPWQGQTVEVVYETLGQGDPVLLLPAFSTVSTRLELQQIAAGLASQFQVVAIDWPGFGESSRLPLDYCPQFYHQCLQAFASAVFQAPVRVVAAGHAAGYALELARQAHQQVRQIALVAPTWRGPLPTMGADLQVAGAVRQLVRSPIIGQALYKLNTLPSFLGWMYRRHVFTDASRLTPEFIQARYRITQQPGARFAPAAFVTGGLDPVAQRQEFLDLLQALHQPVMALISNQAPPGSKAEMEAIAALPTVQSQHLSGSLGLYEEYGAEVTEAILPFFTAGGSAS